MEHYEGLVMQVEHYEWLYLETSMLIGLDWRLIVMGLGWRPIVMGLGWRLIGVLGFSTSFAQGLA